MHLLLVDGFNLIHRIFAGVPGEEGTAAHDLAVLDACQRSLERALNQLAPTHAAIAFEHEGGTWRHRLHPGYKADRPGPPGALLSLLPAIERQFDQASVRALRAPGFEADDVLASVAHRLAPRMHVTILSSDKGYLPLIAAGVRVRHHFEERDFNRAYVAARYGVSPERLTTYLALTGDRSQGIPGVPSIGAKSAQRLVSEHGDLESILAVKELLPPRLSQALHEHEAKARLSLALVTLRTDLDLGLKLSDFRR